ncbi:MAG: response regulator [Euryarchaeota archaeon]|nr:response regulator [Euryarchaeota archaeon]
MSVVIVDDSLYMRTVLAELLRSARVEVVGLAGSARDAMGMIGKLRPDVVLVDLEMPRTDGLALLDAIMAEAPRPVVIMVPGKDVTKAVAHRFEIRGAAGVVKKPRNVATETRTGEDLVNAVIAAATKGNVTGYLSRPDEPGLATRLVVIASSAGGPNALTAVVPRLPVDLAAGVVVVQHMPAGLTKTLANRLDSVSKLPVAEAEDTEPIHESSVLLAPGGWHLLIELVRGVPLARLSDSPPIAGLRPRADLTLESAAKTFGRSTVGVVLTGMGEDGVKGMSAVKANGGRILCQDAASSAIDGMPRAVRDRGLADEVVPLEGLADRIAATVKAIPAIGVADR